MWLWRLQNMNSLISLLILYHEKNRNHIRNMLVSLKEKNIISSGIFQDNNMGEVQYIVTLPQSNQPSAIQLPSREICSESFQGFIELFRWTNHSIISDDSITYGNHWSMSTLKIQFCQYSDLIDRILHNNMQFSPNRINFKHRLNIFK